MSKGGGSDLLLTRISARAHEDLERHRRAASAWRVVDALLLVPAALAAGGGTVLGLTGVLDIPVAVAVVLMAALVAGLSVVFDLPGRARRAEVAALHLAAFVAQTEGLSDHDAAMAGVRSWFVRINAAITEGLDELDAALLGPPGAPVIGGSVPGQNGSAPEPEAEEAGPDAPRPATGQEQESCYRAAERAGARHVHRLRWAFVLAMVFLVVEAAVALATDSLSLLSDAGHVLADGVGLGLALAAVHLASNGRNRNPSRTFGMYRLEIVAALANAALLLGVAGYVLVEAARRMGDAPEVPGTALLGVALAGLAANLVSFWLLRPGASESLNVRAAYLDVVADAIASVGVLTGGVAIRLTGWTWIDPAVGAAIGLWILPRAWTLGREAFRVLVQAAPPEVDMQTVEADLRSVPGVAGVHRLHLWTLTSDLEVASAHLTVDPGADLHRVLDEAQLLLRDRYHVAHTTLQIERDGNACADLDW